MSNTSASQQPEYNPNNVQVTIPETNRTPGQGDDNALMNSLWLALNDIGAIAHVPERSMALGIIGFNSGAKPLAEPIGALCITTQAEICAVKSEHGFPFNPDVRVFYASTTYTMGDYPAYTTVVVERNGEVFDLAMLDFNESGGDFARLHFQTFIAALRLSKEVERVIRQHEFANGRLELAPRS